MNANDNNDSLDENQKQWTKIHSEWFIYLPAWIIKYYRHYFFVMLTSSSRAHNNNNNKNRQLRITICLWFCLFLSLLLKSQWTAKAFLIIFINDGCLHGSRPYHASLNCPKKQWNIKKRRRNYDEIFNWFVDIWYRTSVGFQFQYNLDIDFQQTNLLCFFFISALFVVGIWCFLCRSTSSIWSNRLNWFYLLSIFHSLFISFSCLPM